MRQTASATTRPIDSRCLALIHAGAELLRPPPDRHPDQWADENRYLPPGSAIPGQWKSSRTPYMIRIMREAASGRRKRVTMICGSQMSKSESFLNVAGARLEDDPAPVLWISPTKSNAEKVIEPRFMQMVNHCDSLKIAYRGGKKSSKTRKLIGGVSFRLAWAGSATEIASDPAALVVIDELDRVSADVAGEGDLVEMADARHDSYPEGITLVTSSPKKGSVNVYIHPETGMEHWEVAESDQLESAVWRLWQEGTRHEFAWPCPHCDEYFVPRLRHLKWPEKATPEIAELGAYVQCPNCKEAITDEFKADMNRRGQHVAPGQSVAKDGTVIGDEPDSNAFSSWISGLCSPWKTFGERAARYVSAARSGQPERLQAVINTVFGELYREAVSAADWQRDVYVLRQPYQRGEVPRNAIVLYMTVDVQKDRLIYVVRAWGERMTSWLVQSGELVGETEFDAVWGDLAEFRDMKFGEAQMGIKACWIDSGYKPGDRFKRPDNQIYAFCRRHPGWAQATKGQQSLDRPIKPSQIDIKLGGRLYRRGLVLLHLDTDHYKSWVHGRLAWPDGEPGGWHLPQDIDEDYCKQIVAESRVIKPSGKAVWLRLSKENHKLDCEMMQAAAADFYRVWAMKWTAPEQQAQAGGLADLGALLNG